MSQRRATAAAKVPNPSDIPTTSIIKETIVDEMPVAQGSSLTAVETEQEKEPLNSLSSLDEPRHETDKHNLRVKHWRESPWACGLTEPTWEAERSSTSHRSSHRQKFGDDDLNPDSSGCLCCSAMICPFLGAGRVGNMAVLSQSTEWVEEVEQDDETGEEKVKRFTRPKLNIVLGPYWPMLLFVTYPLILGVSFWAFWTGILPNKKPWFIVVGWFAITFGLIFALAFTGCRDPGILYRHSQPPPQYENNWRWTEQAQSYRPRNAHYDSDTAVVVQAFDHTCPWTGTAIGEKNMCPFQTFVCLVFICLVVDIFLITGAM